MSLAVPDPHTGPGPNRQEIRADAQRILMALTVARMRRVERVKAYPGDALLRRLPGYGRLGTALAGHPPVAGFGLWTTSDGGTRAAILSYRRDLRGETADVDDVPDIARLLAPVRDDLETEPLVIGLAAPELQAGYGSTLAADEVGTAGALVTRTSDGAAGLLTAGHVATTVGTPVAVDGRPWGAVAFTTHATLNPADVAFIERHEGSPDPDGACAIQGTCRPEPGDFVTTHGSRRSEKVNVLGIMAFQWFPALGRNLEQIVVTAEGASGPGDSGGVVLLSTSQELVGHVVGGRKDAYTCVQLGDLILSAAACELTQ